MEEREEKERKTAYFIWKNFLFLPSVNLIPLRSTWRYSVTSFIQYARLILLCHTTALLVQYSTCLRQKENVEAGESYKMLVLIKNMTDAHKISLLSFMSLSRRHRYSYCMIVHIIDDNKKDEHTMICTWERNLPSSYLLPSIDWIIIWKLNR
jgi:uncharacterized membrane protein